MRGKEWVGPKHYLESDPTAQSIQLGGRYINLNELAKGGGFDHGYLSYIFSGQRSPTLVYAKRIAAALGMSGVDELFDAIQDRKSALDAAYRKRLAS